MLDRRDRRAPRHDASSAWRPTGRRLTNPKGGPIANPAKDATVPGALVSPTTGARPTGRRRRSRPTPAYFYVAEQNGYAMYYLTDPDPRGSMGLGGQAEVGVGSNRDYLTAIDYKTGKVVWRHRYPRRGGGGGGMLATAGRLVFAGDGGGNFVALRRRHRRSALAREDRQRQQPAPDVHARRPPVPDRRHGRHAVGVPVVLTLVKLKTVNSELTQRPPRPYRSAAGSCPASTKPWPTGQSSNAPPPHLRSRYSVPNRNSALPCPGRRPTRRPDARCPSSTPAASGDTGSAALHPRAT